MNTAPKPERIRVAGLSIQVVRKPVKNLHLSVYPPAGRLRMTLPQSMDAERGRLFAVSRLGWIRRKVAEMRSQDRQAPRKYLTGETHYLFGQGHRLRVVEGPKAAVSVAAGAILLAVPGRSTRAARAAAMAAWYRGLLKEAIPTILAKHEKRLGVKVKEWGVKRMRTKWGTCNPRAARIWLNLDLAKRPMACLNYVVLHEAAHLLEKGHGEKFQAILDRQMPGWRTIKAEMGSFLPGE